MKGIRPFFPKERGVRRVDDRKVLSGIIHVIWKGLRRVMQRQLAVHPKRSTTVSADGPTTGRWVASWTRCWRRC